MGITSNEKKSLLDRLYLGEKVTCSKCHEGFYEPVGALQNTNEFKCNKCGNGIHITPSVIVE